MTTHSEAALESRTTPVQQRGQARVDALLDAAAEIVDASGLAAMTTSAIAERSGSSVGAVYRYFPNADAVLVALADRFHEQYEARLAGALAARPPATWQDFARLCIEIYASMAQHVPAFRKIRFGDVVAMRFSNRDSMNSAKLGERIDDELVARFGFARSDELVFATQLAMECVDAVTRRAFLHDRDGDERFIEAAEQIIIAILTPCAPETLGQHYHL